MKYRGKHYKSSSERWGKSIKRAEPFLRLLEIVVMLYSAIAISGYAIAQESNTATSDNS